MYPVHIFYTQRMMSYREEMLKSIMRIATFISMNTSMEYAIINTRRHLWGTLKTQFTDIVNKLQRRDYNTLGDAFEHYTPIWNEVNPDFVKSLRLIETAAMSKEEDRMKILDEVQETLIISYHTMGKRFAEDLSSKAKSLVTIGVLFPVISLMLLPLVSVFLPEVVSTPLVTFFYTILFPVLLLVMALNFSALRIQVDTIRISDSPLYKKPSAWLLLIGAIIILVFSAPTIAHLLTIDMAIPESVENEYKFVSIIICLLLGLGVALAIFVLSQIYVRKYHKLWKDVDMTERDLPHLLQSFSTYLTLNRSVESIISDIVDDYKIHGFSKHPVVKFFSNIILQLKVSKKSVANLAKTLLPKICPSRKVSGTLSQIISFTDISQESAAKAAKMIRKQTISIYQLDDYIQTMLSETISLINITVSLLAPILCAAAVLMSMAIVKSLVFVEKILSALAFGAKIDLALAKVELIIPPTIIEVVVAIYLLEMILVLSLFSSNIKYGHDMFQFVKTLLSNLMGFLIFVVILVLGYYFLETLVFGEIFAT
ncbi:hypothetical protein KY348_00215 [Candidatus Woesearchaeota archaeon]|nr:hypothetical protein [Candidatus Woesearchaeota archaeon]